VSTLRQEANHNPTAGRRQRNPRGQGGRLRTELVDAASQILAESHDPNELSLRAVARRAGIAATSVYLHFNNVDELAAAVAERHFGELGRAIARAYRAQDDPGLALIAGCKAYCRFGIRHPGHYRILFEVGRPDLAHRRQDIQRLSSSSAQDVLQALIASIERCQQHGLVSSASDAAQVALLVWTALHGMVSLRLNRPSFPWPPLEPMIEQTVRRLVGLHEA
jgi:AcrR family transcriptional regulator